MRVVRERVNFFSNIDRQSAAQSASILQERLEALVAEWLRDTGLWAAEIEIRIERDVSQDAFRVEAKVDVSKFPYLRDALNGVGKDGNL